MAPPLARRWLRDNAYFPIPRKVKPRTTHSSSRRRTEKAETCPNPPLVAFKDPGKVDRLINALEDHFEDEKVRLYWSPRSEHGVPQEVTDAEVESAFKDQFDPGVTKRKGMVLDQWIAVHSEAHVSCNLILFLAATYLAT